MEKNEKDLNKENLIENEMNQKGQLRGNGLLGLSISKTRWLYRICIVIGAVFILFMPTYSPFILDLSHLHYLLSREIGFILFLFGVILYVVYK